MGAAKRRKIAQQTGTFDPANPPAPAPKLYLTAFTVVVPKAMGDAITTLYQFVESHFASHNEFLVELLNQGLQQAALAAQEAVQKKAEQEQAIVKLAVEGDLAEATKRAALFSEIGR